MVDASPSPRSRCSTARPRTPISGEGTGAPPGRGLLPALRDPEASYELSAADAYLANMAGFAAEVAREEEQLARQAPAPSSDALPEQRLNSSSTAQQPTNPDMADTVANMSNWYTSTSQELDALPTRHPGGLDSSSDGLWLYSMFGTAPAGTGPLTGAEQRSLVASHAQLSQRVQHLGSLLSTLNTSADNHDNQLQRTKAELAATLTDNVLLEADYASCTSKETEAYSKLLLKTGDLKEMQDRVRELDAAMLELKKQSKAAKVMCKDLQAKVAPLEETKRDSTARQLLELETLSAGNNELESKIAQFNTNKLHTDLKFYSSLRAAQSLQLQEAAQQLEAARQQGQEAVSAAEVRVAAESAGLEVALQKMQRQLTTTRREHSQVKSQLVDTDAKFKRLVGKLARARNDKDASAAALAAATTTNASLQQDNLDLDATIRMLQDNIGAIRQQRATIRGEVEVAKQFALEADKELAANEVERALVAAEVQDLRDTMSGLDKDYALKEQEMSDAEAAKAAAEAALKAINKQVREQKRLLKQRKEEGISLLQELHTIVTQYAV